MDYYSKMTDLASYARNAAVQATTLVAGSELEKKLTEACSNEPWGASGTMLSELARATFSYDDFKTVMVFVWKNLQLTGSLWRVVYKTLNLLDHLVRNGSERVIEDARDHLRELKALQKFEFVDTEGKDTGVNVREKAKQLIELLGNEELLNEERDKARSARNRYTGVSAQDMGVEDSSKSKDAAVKGFSDDDFKFAADRGRSAASSLASAAGLSAYMNSAMSTVTEYAQVREHSESTAAATRPRPTPRLHASRGPSALFRFLFSPLLHPFLHAGGQQTDAIDVDPLPLL